jgi:hypothetical protein
MRSEDEAAWRSQIIDIYKNADMSSREFWREAIYGLVRPERRYRTSYKDGDKRALMDIILLCAEENIALPKWASKAIMLADDLYVSGQLNSWDDVFGKSFPGKRRAGLLTRLRKREAWRAVVRLKHEGCPSADLFETAARDLGMGASTVRDLYYSVEKEHRFPKSSP